MNKKKMTKLQMKTYEVQISPQDTISQKILSKNPNDFFSTFVHIATKQYFPRMFSTEFHSNASYRSWWFNIPERSRNSCVIDIWGSLLTRLKMCRFIYLSSLSTLFLAVLLIQLTDQIVFAGKQISSCMRKFFIRKSTLLIFKVVIVDLNFTFNFSCPTPNPLFLLISSFFDFFYSHHLYTSTIFFLIFTWL